ncbi:MAG TPA: NAD(P)/FAD-dependent oxidoreductase [Gammaproteobacteria bacterium]|nr:NAD(P)/FAD-dependent oxidoreductase [Gammaproteobacteria bacterium]HRA42429.1 NAD(P)/FAD-dependent oxidoreductase [Gammaproteobacteria bacterium]
MTSKTEYNVIVIGAGMAGLSAAQHLADLGHTVLVLEAKNRVGGRIHTQEMQDGLPIEMGANLLLNPGTTEQPNPLLPLIRHLNLTTMPIDSIPSTTFKAEGYFENATKLINEAKRFPWKTWPSLGEVLKIQDLNFHSHLKLNSTEFIGKQALIHMIEQQTGTLPHNVSLLELMHFGTDATFYDSDGFRGSAEATFINGGYQQLPEAMAKKAIATGKVKILLSTPVEAVHYHNSDTTQVIATNGEKYTAKRILCAVPIGVLQNQSIHFFPKLSPEKQQLIKHLKVGFHNKVVLEFKKVFWPIDTHFLFPGSKHYHHFPEYLNLFHFSNQKTPALVCNFYASEACFKENTDDHIVEKALLPLQEAYGKTAIALKNAFVTHWESDPYALGSTSCYGLQCESRELRNFEKPEQGGLFFAGAHTIANKNRETVQGAYISGIRAALDVNHHLKNAELRGRTQRSAPT